MSTGKGQKVDIWQPAAPMISRFFGMMLAGISRVQHLEAGVVQSCRGNTPPVVKRVEREDGVVEVDFLY